jgi:hypothetical protein
LERRLWLWPDGVGLEDMLAAMPCSSKKEARRQAQLGASVSLCPVWWWPVAEQEAAGMEVTSWLGSMEWYGLRQSVPVRCP